MFYAWLGAIVICYVGMAEAMRGFAVNWARQRVRYPSPRPVSHEPGTQAAVARVDADLSSAQLRRRRRGPGKDALGIALDFEPRWG